jgi:hypothetical protein
VNCAALGLSHLTNAYLSSKSVLVSFSNWTPDMDKYSWSILTSVLYSPSNQQGQMLTYKSTLVKTKLYCIVHQQSCPLLYVLSLPLVHPNSVIPTTVLSASTSQRLARSQSCSLSRPAWYCSAGLNLILSRNFCTFSACMAHMGKLFECC